MVTNGKEVATAKLVDHVEQRLRKGSEEYGATQFWRVPMIGEKTREHTPLVAELQEEAADILGWGALLAVRLRARGWTDLVTSLEVCTANVIRYGDGLKAIETAVHNRLSNA